VENLTDQTQQNFDLVIIIFKHLSKLEPWYLQKKKAEDNVSINK